MVGQVLQRRGVIVLKDMEKELVVRQAGVLDRIDWLKTENKNNFGV